MDAPTLHVVCPSCRTINRLRDADLAHAPACGRCQALLFTGRPVALDEAGFEREIARSDLPVLVDFWAGWCAPCRAMAPAFARAAGLLEPRVRLVKVDTEQAPALSRRLGIRSIPTLALFAGGRELARQAGALTQAEDITRWVHSQRV